MQKEHVTIKDEGSILLFYPNTQEARDWLASNTSSDSLWYNAALVVEPRYAEDLIEAMQEQGFTLSA